MHPGDLTDQLQKELNEVIRRHTEKAKEAGEDITLFLIPVCLALQATLGKSERGFQLSCEERMTPQSAQATAEEYHEIAQGFYEQGVRLANDVFSAGKKKPQAKPNQPELTVLNGGKEENDNGSDN